MKEFLPAWVEIEMDRFPRNNKLSNIRVKDVINLGDEHLEVCFQFADKTTICIPYAYWGNMDFLKALGNFVELMLKRYPSGIRIEKLPDKSAYHFYLPEKD